MGKRVLPSPLRAILAGKKPPSAEKLEEKAEIARQTASELARADPSALERSQHQWTRTRKGRETGAIGKGKATAKAILAGVANLFKRDGKASAKASPRRPPPMRQAGHVPKWDFVSPHAVSQEFLDNRNTVVSIL